MVGKVEEIRRRQMCSFIAWIVAEERGLDLTNCLKMSVNELNEE